MKKSFLFSLGLILALSALFVSCKDEPDNNKEENSGIPCEINIIASEGGDVQFSDYFGNSKHVYTGSKVTIIATADEGYAFIGWYVVGNNEKLVSKTMSYTFTTQGDLQLLAKFLKLQDITIGSTEGGSASFKDSEEKIVHLLPGEDVTVVATVDEGYEFVEWYVEGNLVSKDVEYIFTVTAAVTLVAKFVNYNGHEYVDLGLPSGTKWATCNVGASKPEEYGGYYAWGETEEKSNYDWSTYKWCNGSYYTMTKYRTDSDNGTVDNKTVLDPGDDVAHVKWGGRWRMPTEAELYELRNKCAWTWTTQNGVNGYRVTGPNGNSIFLPAAGYRDGTDNSGRGSWGGYWSSSLDSYCSNDAYGLYFFDRYYFDVFYSDYCIDDNFYLPPYFCNRSYGRSVRPVSE